MPPEKPYNNGQWSQARFNSFIKSLLRKGTQRWGPKNTTLQKARVSKGNYLCEGCKQVVPVTVKKDNKRVRNVFVDHIEPIVSPSEGFISWDKVIERMFCEEDGFQVLCDQCHKRKTAEERQIATERKRDAKRQAGTPLD